MGKYFSVMLGTLLLGVCLLSAEKELFGKSSKSMANSSKECAICHIRWIKSLQKNQKDGSSQYKTRQAGNSDMCLSCHDGSIADSRIKVWQSQNHVTGKPPAKGIKIPENKFPLDSKGHITCATCHTAHAIKDDADLKTAIFLRQPNINSSLCLDCHGYLKKMKPNHHPMGLIKTQIPEAILQAGGHAGNNNNQMICETCHAAHGTLNVKMLIMPPSKLCISCHQEKSNELSDTSYQAIHQLNRVSLGFTPPVNMIKAGAVFGENNKLTCISCHSMHRAEQQTPQSFLRGPPEKLCLECHEKKQNIFGGVHDPTKNKWADIPGLQSLGGCGDCHSAHRKKTGQIVKRKPQTKFIPEVTCKTCHSEKGPGKNLTTTHLLKPLDSISREKPFSEQKIKCVSCHDIHKQDTGTSLLNVTRKGSKLCLECHQKKQIVMGTRHDLRVSAPSDTNNLGQTAETSGPCSACHLIHNYKEKNGPWAFKFWPGIDSSKALCLSCHSSVIEVSPLDSSVHEGVKKSKSCGDCHLTHSGGGDKFLVQPISNACFKCHDKKIELQDSRVVENIKEKMKNSKSIHEPVKKGDCQRCHKGHKSPFPRMLSEKYPVDVYDIYNLDNYSLCIQNCHQPELITGAEYDSTGFRDGAVNLHYLHVNQEKSRTCKVCHLPHASDLLHLMRKNIEFGPERWNLNLNYKSIKTGGSCVSACHRKKLYDRKVQKNKYKKKPE